ncbi:hypothetical protein VNO78_19555 [Psophocarpus tetragonolobus]|uniref:Uncharacterized protein n=1 Tax=Psophocarpus tetragonolobus TaxID=3891 RepID=A0AAN9XFX7_PSOTE
MPNDHQATSRLLLPLAPGRLTIPLSIALTVGALILAHEGRMLISHNNSQGQLEDKKVTLSATMVVFLLKFREMLLSKEHTKTITDMLAA